jgi:hypothetical protein
LGRWTTFFVFVFLIGSILTLLLEGGGFAATTLTSSVNTSATTWTLASTDGFLGASVTHPAYAQCGDEIVFYTSLTAPSTISGISRGQSDPQSGVATAAAAHSTGSYVKTLNIAAIDSFIGYNISQSNATFGALDALTFFGRMFTNLPKMLMNDYPWFTGQARLFQYVLLCFTAGFVVSLGLAMLWLGLSIWKP